MNILILLLLMLVNINIPYPRTFLPKQKEVLDACERIKYILYSGAYGAGKTLLMSHVVIKNCIRYPRSLWFFGSQTVPQLRDTVVRTFLEEIDLYQDNINNARDKLPEDEQDKLSFRIMKQYKLNEMSFKFFNGSEVLFRSCDEASKFKSLNLDGFAIDEPVDIDEEVFKMLQGRLRGMHTKHRIGVMAGNPAGRTNWVYQRFIEKPTKNYFWVHTTTFDNTFLAKDYVNDMVTSYDEDYKRRYLYGEWGSFAGQVYKDFSYDKHVGNFRDGKYKYYIAGYDDGYRNPACFLTLGIDSDNHVYVVDEVYESGITNDKFVKDVALMNKKYNFQKIFADPSAQNWIQLARENKLRVHEANNDLDSGIAKVKMFFHNDIINIDSRCKNLIKELESYRYEKDKFSKNLTERPIKKDDHAVDALRYAFTAFNPFKKKRRLAVGSFK